MTTIATDATSIAWDSRIMINDDEYFDSPEHCDKVRVHNGHIFAMAGDAGMLPYLIEWWHNGANWDDLPDYSDALDADDKPNWELLVIDLNTGRREMRVPNVRGAVYTVPDKWAFGTGSLAARTAMACGKTAKQAVEIAAMMCVGTGGPIQCLKFKDVS